MSNYFAHLIVAFRVTAYTKTKDMTSQSNAACISAETQDPCTFFFQASCFFFDVTKKRKTTPTTAILSFDAAVDTQS